MKRLLSIALLGCFSMALVGCSASGSVDTPNDHASTSDTSYKKTTYKDANGNVTETKVQKTNNP